MAILTILGLEVPRPLNVAAFSFVACLVASKNQVRIDNPPLSAMFFLFMADTVNGLPA
jgi:hypothetical protein